MIAGDVSVGDCVLPPPRPGYRQLLRATVAALAAAAISLWVLSAVLALAGLWPFNSVDPLKPWVIDGVWSLVAALAWGALVSLFIAGLLLRSSVWYERAKPSAWWTAGAVAIGVYGVSLLPLAWGLRVLLALAITPLFLAQIAYLPTGAVRRWRLGRRGERALLIAALLLVASFAVTHPYAAGGSGVENSGGNVAEGASVGLNGALIPTQVVAARFSATVLGSRTTVTVPGVVTGDGDAGFSSMGERGASTGARPGHFGSHQEVWVGFGEGTGSICPAGAELTLTEVTLHYRILGIATSQRVKLQSPTTVHCPSA